MLEFLVLTCLNCSSWEQEELFIYTSIKSSKYNRKVYKIAYSPIGLPASLLISPNIGNLTPIYLLSTVIGPTVGNTEGLARKGGSELLIFDYSLVSILNLVAELVKLQQHQVKLSVRFSEALLEVVAIHCHLVQSFFPILRAQQWIVRALANSSAC